MTRQHAPRILVLGAGFGGLSFCKAFHHPTAEVTVVDRQNHHLFQPLLYQVATAGLSSTDIAQPIRSILANRPHVRVRLDEVTDIQLTERRVLTAGGVLEYDYLILALGCATSYFGHPEWEQFAPGLKTLDDAQRIRRELLLAFERAEDEEDAAVCRRLMTIVIVGGGPTGVELAGACAELTRVVLRSDFRKIDSASARIILMDGAPRLLGQFPESLSAEAKDRLEGMGVEVRSGARVQNVRRGRVELVGGEVLEAENILWAAGVSANSLTQKLGVEIDRGGRIKVEADLSLPGHPEVFAIGDLAAAIDKDGQIVPGVAPAATQAARYVARLMENELNGETERPAFDYWDKGSLATIGRSSAVAKVGSFEITGFPAWVAWLGVHLVFLIGFRNRIAVLISWAYSYLTYKRGARIITGLPRNPSAP